MANGIKLGNVVHLQLDGDRQKESVLSSNSWSRPEICPWWPGQVRAPKQFGLQDDIFNRYFTPEVTRVVGAIQWRDSGKSCIQVVGTARAACVLSG
jgi:hypothetical protein